MAIRDCTGPRSGTEDLGVDVGFEDLPKGTLRQLRPEYFQMFDRLTGILVAHGIAPVYQPVFHGYGWKGRRVAGNVASAEDYARYCRYLVARYGARPAIWLVGGDGPATDPAIVEQLDRAGQTIEEWDAYHQPTGIHYSPHALNRTHQDTAPAASGSGGCTRTNRTTPTGAPRPAPVGAKRSISKARAIPASPRRSLTACP